MPRKSTDNDITTLHATVKVLAAVMVVVLIGVYVLQLGHENLVETNAATASDVYPATDACFNATNNATALTPPDVCSRSGRLYACGCANCTLRDKCFNQDLDYCLCPIGISFNGTRALATSNGMVVGGYVLIIACAVVGWFALVFLLLAVPSGCKKMQDDDEDRTYHRLNDICCENVVARALLFLLSPVFSVHGVFFGIIGGLIILFFPCVYLAVAMENTSGREENPREMFMACAAFTIFSFTTIVPYPYTAALALYRSAHPCACCGCAGKLSKNFSSLDGEANHRGKSIALDLKVDMMCRCGRFHCQRPRGASKVSRQRE